MESYKELKERMNRIIEQKDRFGEALGKLLDAIKHGRYNGLFEAGFREMKDNTKVCSQGVKFSEVKWSGCPKVLECPTHACPMTFEMRHLMEAYQKGLDVLDEQDAARIPFKANEIPPYEPSKYDYKVSIKWFAKEVVRIILAMRLGSDNKVVGGNVALSNAFKRLVGFGMESIGMKEAWIEFLKIDETAIKMERSGKAASAVADWFEQKLEEGCFKHFKSSAQAAHKLFEKRDKLEKMIRKAPSRALRYLVLSSLVTMSEFNFVRHYPSADLCVYAEAFAWIGRLCLYAVKIKPEDRLGILELSNSEDRCDDFKMTPIDRV